MCRCAGPSTDCRVSGLRGGCHQSVCAVVVMIIALTSSRTASCSVSCWREWTPTRTCCLAPTTSVYITPPSSNSATRTRCPICCDSPSIAALLVNIIAPSHHRAIATLRPIVTRYSLLVTIYIYCFQYDPNARPLFPEIVSKLDEIKDNLDNGTCTKYNYCTGQLTDE